jgi:hypothetical protein
MRLGAGVAQTDWQEEGVRNACVMDSPLLT